MSTKVATKEKNDYSLKNYQILGYTRDFNVCECCGKQDLAGTVAILDLQSGVELHFGSTCAAKADKYDSLEAAAKAKVKIRTLQQQLKDLDNNAFMQAYRANRALKGTEGYDAAVQASHDEYYQKNVEKVTFMALNREEIETQTKAAQDELRASEEHVGYWGYIEQLNDCSSPLHTPFYERQGDMKLAGLSEALEIKKAEIITKYPFTKYSYIS
jgi:hypothetical protein